MGQVVLAVTPTLLTHGHAVVHRRRGAPEDHDANGGQVERTQQEEPISALAVKEMVVRAAAHEHDTRRQLDQKGPTRHELLFAVLHLFLSEERFETRQAVTSMVAAIQADEPHLCPLSNGFDELSYLVNFFGLAEVVSLLSTAEQLVFVVAGQELRSRSRTVVNCLVKPIQARREMRWKTLDDIWQASLART